MIVLAAIGMAADMPADARAMPMELARSLEIYHHATVARDVATLAGIVTDDYTLVNSDATVQGKRSYLADFRVPGFAIEPYAVRNATFRNLGGSALTGGEMDLRWTQDGARRHRHLRFVHVWVRQAGRWRITYSQLTRVPEPDR